MLRRKCHKNWDFGLDTHTLNANIVIRFAIHLKRIRFPDFISYNLEWSPLTIHTTDGNNKAPPVWTTACRQLVFLTQGVRGPLTHVAPSGRDFHAKHSEPLGMLNPYLVVACDERLPGTYCSSAVHFQVRVVILPYKYLKDVQHLERERRQREHRDSEKRNTEERRDWGLDYL